MPFLYPWVAPLPNREGASLPPPNSEVPIMAALIKLTGRSLNHLMLKPAEGVLVRGTDSLMGRELSSKAPSIVLVGGEKDGQPAEGTALRANQKVWVQLGTASPSKYQVLIESNPTLAAEGTVQHARILESGGGAQPVGFFFRADRAVDLATFDWLMRLYVLD
jgi:hypothetical protein